MSTYNIEYYFIYIQIKVFLKLFVIPIVLKLCMGIIHLYLNYIKYNKNKYIIQEKYSYLYYKMDV